MAEMKKPSCLLASSYCGLTGQSDEGAAMYVAVVILIFAIGIGLLIGMMSFKKTNFEDWDRQGNSLID